MKKYFIYFFFTLLHSNLYSQGGASSCAQLQANPELYQSCATSIPFSNQTAGSSENILPNCFSEPIKAPTWFFMRIKNSGNITLQISQVNNAGAGIDVDFGLWGPFSDLSNICNMLNNNTLEDCSWLPLPIETVQIPNAVSGDYYILMVDNYAQEAGQISISQIGGTGSSDCSFLSSVAIKDTNDLEINEFAYCNSSSKDLKAIVNISNFSANPNNLRFNYRWSKDGVVINSVNNSLSNTNILTVSQTGVYKVEIAAYDITDPLIDINNIPFLPDQDDEIELEFVEPPVLFNSLVEQCDFVFPNNDGFALFNLTQSYNNLTNSVAGINLKFYLDSALTQEIVNPTNFTNTQPFSQTLYVTGNKNATKIVCNSPVVTLNIQVNPTSITNFPNLLPVCPIEGLNYNLFDLEAQKLLIKNTYYPNSSVSITFYLSASDASIELNEITNNQRFSIGITPIYVRVESNINCSGIGIFTVEVIAPPVVANISPIKACPQDEVYLVQKDSEILLGQNPAVQTSYFFSYSNALSSSNSINKNLPLSNLSVGTVPLFVKLTNINTQCFTITTFNLIIYQTPASLVINPNDILAFNDANYVIAIAEPLTSDYEYNINGGTWQESNIFSDLPIGESIIKVRNKNGCNEIEAFVTVVDFPKYFTPNGDGFNDVWIFSEADSFYETTIFIYNRYGKLLKQIRKNSGWDGTFNNSLQPSDDYWFTLLYTKNGIKKTFFHHFSLKR